MCYLQYTDTVEVYNRECFLFQIFNILKQNQGFPVNVCVVKVRSIFHKSMFLFPTIFTYIAKSL